MFLCALEDNATEDPALEDATLYTLDESDYWLSSMLSYAPDRLKRRLETHVIKPKLVKMHQTTVSIISATPPAGLEFLYVDGGLVPGNAVGADALLAETSAESTFSILIDGRGRTCHHLKRWLRRPYNITNDPIHHWTLFKPQADQHKRISSKEWGLVTLHTLRI
jgi:hypothetical protein